MRSTDMDILQTSYMEAPFSFQMGSLSVGRSGLNRVATSRPFFGPLLPPPPPPLRIADAKNFNFGAECCNQSVPDIAKGLAKADNVLVMAGAGMSTPSGIPDFRSPGG